ncbi:MAG: SAM-dependent chlorinase/fluorinase [Desulfobacterales bacterium]|nr:SAM-dependent chlorinase/fluorinase [Desulfobacterales bacterium]
MAVISLTTDFGLQDEYVGVMKGVILAAAPASRIVDLCHGIEPHNVVQAAFMIEAAFRHFPPESLHLLVVDPGVGGKRRILFAEAGGHRFICPDNGLLTRIAQTAGLGPIREVANRRLFSPRISATFHGRDIMAPAAAFVARGGDPAQLGDEISGDAIVRLKTGVPQMGADGRLRGLVVSIDRFGNLITNIGRDLLDRWLRDNPKQLFQIDIGGQLTTHLHDAYEEALPGQTLAILGSRQTLEIAVNQGSARDRYQVDTGCAVTALRLTAPGHTSQV